MGGIFAGSCKVTHPCIIPSQVREAKQQQKPLSGLSFLTTRQQAIFLTMNYVLVLIEIEMSWNWSPIVF